MSSSVVSASSSTASSLNTAHSKKKNRPAKSLAQIQHEQAARAWHDQLVQLNQRRHQRFAQKLAQLQDQHTKVIHMAIRARGQSQALEGLLKQLCHAQRVWAQQLQWGVLLDEQDALAAAESQEQQQHQSTEQNDDHDNDDEDEEEGTPQIQTFSTALYGSPKTKGRTTTGKKSPESSLSSSAQQHQSFVPASLSMGKTTRHMVHKIHTMGVQTLAQVLDRLAQLSKLVQEQQEELEHVGRTAFQALHESQTKVERSWKKYLQDAQRHGSTGDNNNNANNNNANTQNGAGSSLQSAMKSSMKQSSATTTVPSSPSSSPLSTNTHEHVQGLRSRSDSHDDDPAMDIRRQSKEQPYKQNANLRAMEHAAGVAASYADVWLSEWSYRAHVLEQVTLWEGAHERLTQLFQQMQETEKTRRYQFRQDMTHILERQQKLAVTLEATATVGLMEYWEQQNQFLERQERADEISSMTQNHQFSDGSSSRPTNTTDDPGENNDATKKNGDKDATDGSDAAKSSTETKETSTPINKEEVGSKTPPPAKTPPMTLPSLTKSGYVTLTSLAKRSSMDRSDSTLSLMVMTTDGILYFFDLPPSSKVSFQSTTSVAQAWEAVLAAEFQKQLEDSKSSRSSEFIIVVPPPLPSLRFVLAQCSVEMTSIDDCEAQFCIPESQGEDFRIELASTRSQIAFSK